MTMSMYIHMHMYILLHIVLHVEPTIYVYMPMYLYIRKQGCCWLQRSGQVSTNSHIRQATTPGPPSKRNALDRLHAQVFSFCLFGVRYIYQALKHSLDSGRSSGSSCCFLLPMCVAAWPDRYSFTLRRFCSCY